MNVVDIRNLAESPYHDPCQKLWAMVLLLALKDQATEIRYEPWRRDQALRYKVGGTYYALVPPPSRLAGELIRVIQEFCNPPKPQTWKTRWANRFRRWAERLDPDDKLFRHEWSSFGVKLEKGIQVSARLYPPPDSEKWSGVVLTLTPDPTLGEHADAVFKGWAEAQEERLAEFPPDHPRRE